MNILKFAVAIIACSLLLSPTTTATKPTTSSSNTPSLSKVSTSDAEKLKQAEKSQIDAETELKNAIVEKKRDEETVAKKPITQSEFSEAKLGSTRMHRAAGEEDVCGHAYCSDLVDEYKPDTMKEDKFMTNCQNAHHDWELETSYSLSCDPKNPVRLKAQAAEELRKRTMKLINDRRHDNIERKANLHATDSAAATRAVAGETADVAAGRKQKQSQDMLTANIDVPQYITEKRDALKVRVRCKNGNKVDTVYNSVNKKDQQRIPNCPEDEGNKVEMKPEQGYLRAGENSDVDNAFKTN